MSECVRGAWLALGGQATVDEAIDLDAVSRFLALVAEHETGGDVRDWNLLVDALATMYPTPQAETGTRVQVMTLHKAKGLEFDTVILPGLARIPPGDDEELLRWRTRPRGLLLAPIKARGGDADPIYAYLDLLAAAEADHELGRLLYVGTTRARARLHLIATADIAEGTTEEPPAWKPPRASSALAKLWPALATSLPQPTRAPGPVADAATIPPPRLRRFPAGFALPSLAATTRMPAGALPARSPVVPFEWAHAAAAAIGTVTHRLLAQLAREGIAHWNGERVAGLGSRIRMELRAEGVDEAQLALAGADVDRAMRNVIEDSRGRWLFDPAHADAASEWTLAGIDAGAIVHVSLDRTFAAVGRALDRRFQDGTSRRRGHGGVPGRARRSATARNSSVMRASCVRSIRAPSGLRCTTRWSRRAGANGHSRRSLEMAI